ncbi:hypothetical protein ACA910_000864 [Epithemia clementina (nom. ined.)]
MLDEVQAPVAAAQLATRTLIPNSSTWGMSGWTTCTTTPLQNNSQTMAATTAIVASASTAPTAFAENATPDGKPQSKGFVEVSTSTVSHPFDSVPFPSPQSCSLFASALKEKMSKDEKKGHTGVDPFRNAASSLFVP